MIDADTVTVETGGSRIVAAPNLDCTVFVYVPAGSTIYIGDVDVTVADGFPLVGPVTITFDSFSDHDELWGIASGANVDVKVLVRTSSNTPPEFGTAP